VKKLLVLGALAGALSVGAVFAWATPGAGIVSGPVVARGNNVTENLVLGTPTTVTMTRRVTVRVSKKKVVRRTVRFTVPSVTPLITCGSSTACDTAFQHIKIAPNGHTGWHTHPGPTLVAIVGGEGTLYHAGEAGCPGHKFGANAGFLQPSSDVHILRNEGSAQLELFAFYVLPPGTPNTAIRTDQAQPAGCPNIP
jgi:mannose-6-phosphate isomerase-like protein (cupin superfamily)